MSDPALELFNSLSSWKNLQALVDAGETEGLHLECKSLLSPDLNRGMKVKLARALSGVSNTARKHFQTFVGNGKTEDVHLEGNSTLSPNLNPDMKVKLARALSGFSNTAGGVILWGVATTRHSHSKPGVLSNLEPVGDCALFEKHIRSAIPTLTSPNIWKFKTKLIKKRKTDTQGIVAAYIPLTTGTPLISSIDNVFYFRRQEEFVTAPHELIKRLFTTTDIPATPDVYPSFTQDFVQLETDGSWSLRILVDNRSTAFAKDVGVSVTIDNPSSCEDITASNFRETSRLNPDRKTYKINLERGIYRYMPVVAGNLKVKMKKNKIRLDISIKTYAKRMQARCVKYELTFTESKFTVITISDDYLY